MRERAEVRGQVKVLSAEGRISAKILIGLPFLVGGALAVLRPDYMSPLLHSAIGFALLAVGVTLLALGSLWCSRLVKIEV
jgi:tight adherence protein B